MFNDKAADCSVHLSSDHLLNTRPVSSSIHFFEDWFDLNRFECFFKAIQAVTDGKINKDLKTR